MRGVLCNWLVCCAVWMAGAATSLPGKALAAYLPVMAFITMGLEHSVANMFFCSLGIVQVRSGDEQLRVWLCGDCSGPDCAALCGGYVTCSRAAPPR